MTAPPSARTRPTPTPSSVVGAAARAAAAAGRGAEYVRNEAPGWVGGALAGVQGALFSFALVLVPVWVIVASAADSTVTWGDATGVAARVWLTGFAVPWAVDGVPISLIPLGIPLLTALMLAQLARRFASATWVAGVAAGAAFVATTGIICSLAWADADDAGSRVVRAALVAAVVAAPAIAWGLMRQRGAALPWLDSLPVWLRGGVRLSVALGSSVVAIAALTLAASSLAGRYTVAASVRYVGVDAVGGIALAGMETLYAPTLVVWVVSWLSGAGFTMGGALTSSAQAPGDTLAAVPILGTLPTASGGPLALTPLLLVVVGALLTWALRAKLGSGREALYAVALAIGLIALATAVASRVAVGGMGPGALASVGPEPAIAATMLAAELGAGALAVLATRAALGVARARRATAARPRSAQVPRRETPPHTEDHPSE